MRRLVPFVALLILVGGAGWYLWGRLAPSTPPTSEDSLQAPPPPLSYETKPEIGSLAPNFLLETTNGKEVRLSDYLDRVVIVNFWATWCPFCRVEQQNFRRLLGEYPRDLVIISINRAETPLSVVQEIVKYFNPTRVTYLMDPTDAIYDLYKGVSMPQTFFIDRAGVVRDIKFGESTLDDMRRRVKPLIERH